MDFHELPIPAEMKEAIEQHLIQQQMSVTSFRHDVQRLFEELDKDHLLTLRHLMGHLVRVEDGRYAAYLEGVIAATLHQRFNVCSSCGVNHEEEMLTQPEQVDGGEQPSLFDKEREAVDHALIFQHNLEKYNVEPIDQAVVVDTLPPDLMKRVQVKCKGCSAEYVSLEDRMVKPPGPENCEGCIHKTKWG